MSEGYVVCHSCGAVAFGNITCVACRNHMRGSFPGGRSEMLDRLDAINPETVAPCGPDEIREFVDRLEQFNERKERL